MIAFLPPRWSQRRFCQVGAGRRKAGRGGHHQPPGEDHAVTAGGCEIPAGCRGHARSRLNLSFQDRGTPHPPGGSFSWHSSTASRGRDGSEDDSAAASCEGRQSEAAGNQAREFHGGVATVRISRGTKGGAVVEFSSVLRRGSAPAWVDRRKLGLPMGRCAAPLTPPPHLSAGLPLRQAFTSPARCRMAARAPALPGRAPHAAPAAQVSVIHPAQESGFRRHRGRDGPDTGGGADIVEEYRLSNCPVGYD
jgi:hypothetical protein